MKPTIIQKYSTILHKKMSILIFGSYGTPLIFISSKNQTNDDWIQAGMVDKLSEYIDNKHIRLVFIETCDEQLMSTRINNEKYFLIDKYYQYVFSEALPLICQNCHKNVRPFLAGCGTGAYHAASLFFKKPELFQGLLGLSGVYTSTQLFGEQENEGITKNDPISILSANNEQTYLALLNSNNIILCGNKNRKQSFDDTELLSKLFMEKAVLAYVEIMEPYVDFNFDLWLSKMNELLPKLLFE